MSQESKTEKSTTDVDTNNETESKEDELLGCGSTSKQDAAYISNPLVVIVGIGDFEGQLPKLYVERDYQNIIFSLNYTRGYHIVYYNRKNELIHLTNRANTSKDYEKSNFKIRWNEKEITQFNTIIKKQILQPQVHRYNSLIYFISTHGRPGNIIYDSEMKKIKLNSIINKFDNVNCDVLEVKPKIFILDHCRGKMVAKMKNNESYQAEMENKNNTPEKPPLKKCEKEKAKEKELKEKERMLIVDSINTPVVNAASHICKIFSNVDGYAVPDSGPKGGYLIRFLTKVIINDDWFKGLDLNRMILQTRLVLQNCLGVKEGLHTQVIDAVSTIPSAVKFKENEKVLPKQITINNSRCAAVTSKVFSKISSKLIQDLQSQFEVKNISNPLVVFAGIEYNTQSLDLSNCPLKRNGIQTRDNMYKDFGRMLYAFHCMLNYCIMYQSIRKDGECLMHLGFDSSAKGLSGRAIKQEQNKLKTKWNGDEWEEFNNQVRKQLSTDSLSNYDGLIYILTCHGEEEDTMYLSDGNDCCLAFLFDIFNNERCRHLREKPKIFIVNNIPVNSNDVLKLPPPKAEKVALQDVETQYRDVLYQRLVKQVNNNKESNSFLSNIGNELSSISVRSKENQEYAREDEKQVELKSQYWNHMAYRKESHFRYIYSTPEGYTNDQIIFDHSKGSPLIRTLGIIVPQMLKQSQQQAQQQAQQRNNNQNDEKKNENENERNVVGVEFDDMVINISSRINKDSIKNFDKIKEALEQQKQKNIKEKQMEKEKEKQKVNVSSQDEKKSGEDDFDPNLLRQILYSPIVQDNNRMPYFMRLIPRKKR